MRHRDSDTPPTAARGGGSGTKGLELLSKASPPSRRSALALSAFMVAAGVAHFVAPEPYARIVPRFLGRPRFFVAASGVAEIVAGVLLVTERTRRAGAWLTLGILVGVFPANVKMALDGGIEGQGFLLGSPVVAWLRLPLQVPLIIWAWQFTRRRQRSDKDRDGS